MGVDQVEDEESVNGQAAAGLGEAVLVTGQAVVVTEQAGAVQVEAEQATEVGQGDQVWTRQQGQQVWLQAGTDIVILSWSVLSEELTVPLCYSSGSINTDKVGIIGLYLQHDTSLSPTASLGTGLGLVPECGRDGQA